MHQDTHALFNLSPLDGRYSSKTRGLTSFFSEAALQRYRIIVEVEWLIFMCNHIELDGTRTLTNEEIETLQNLYIEFNEESAARIKEIEKTTNHDVKAVEYFIKEELKKSSLKEMLEFVHFGCTSEDINNLCHAMMLRDAMDEVVVPNIFMLTLKLKELANEYRDIPLLSRTHGQSASPTTMGKELTVFISRIERQLAHALNQEYFGKFNGAVGNYNAHLSAYPEENWMLHGTQFIEHLDLPVNLFTTQIENHDYMAELFDSMKRLNTILIDLNRDIWSYISRGYFAQKLKEGEIGSSTMPHKVNPIDFENSEGNLGLANAMFAHLSGKLPISRLQRDLTDSTVLRNMGVAYGYSVIAYESTIKGLSKLKINEDIIADDLNSHWEVLAEPIQTVMRRYNVEKPYEKLKELTRGKKVDKKSIGAFIDGLKEIPKEERERLKKMTPANYIGDAIKLTDIYLAGGPNGSSGGCCGGGCHSEKEEKECGGGKCGSNGCC